LATKRKQDNSWEALKSNIRARAEYYFFASSGECPSIDCKNLETSIQEFLKYERAKMTLASLQTTLDTMAFLEKQRK